MATKIQAEANVKTARERLRSKQIEISKLEKTAVFKGVRIIDQFNVGRSGIKPFRVRRKSERRRTLKQLGLSRSEIPMLRDELNLRKSELDFFNPPALGDII